MHLGSLRSNEGRDEPSSALAERWSLHEKLTAAQLNDAAKRYLKDAPHLHLTLLPQLAGEAEAEGQQTAK